MTRGSLIGLAAGGAATVVGIIVAAALIMRGCGNDDAPRAAATGPTPASRAGAEGMGAKGTAELRALGCSNALVVDLQRLLGPSGKVRPGEPRYMVTCDVDSPSAAPTCEQLAGTYFGAIGGTADANVCARVTVAAAHEPTCSRLFAPNGADLGPFPK